MEDDISKGLAVWVEVLLLIKGSRVLGEFGPSFYFLFLIRSK